MAAREHPHISDDTWHRRIHILSVIDDLYFGGDEYRLHAFGSCLDQARFHHTVLTVKKEDGSLAEQYGSMRNQYRQSGIRLLDLGEAAVSPADKTPRSLAQQMSSAKNKVGKLAWLMRHEQVDVLDVHLAPANPIGALAAIKTRTPFAVTLYQVDQIRSKGLWLSSQFNLGCAAQLITDSEAQAGRVREWLVRRPPLCVIPNGTPPPTTDGRQRTDA